MMGGRDRPGVGEQFAEYHDFHDPIIEGEHLDVEYQIYLQKRRPEGGSHYSAYVCVPRLCRHHIDTKNQPRAPGHHGVNFGPTEDGWIGFGTLDCRDHNYDSSMQPLPNDHRDEPMFEEDAVENWTPEILHDAVLGWIDELVEYIEDDHGCQACENDL